MTLDAISKSDAFSLAVKYGTLLSANSAFIAQAKRNLIADNGMNRQLIVELNKLYIAQEKYEAGFALHKGILFEDGYESAEYQICRAYHADNAHGTGIKASEIEDIHSRIDVMQENLANMNLQTNGIAIEYSEKYVRKVVKRMVKRASELKDATLIHFGFEPETEKISTRAKNGYAVKRVSQKSRLGLSGKGRLSNAQLTQLAALDAQE